MSALLPSIRRQMTLLLLIPSAVAALVLGLVAFLVAGWLLAVVVAVLGAAAACLVCWLGAERFVLRKVGARPIAKSEQPRLANMVEGLCLANGVREPSLHLVDSPAVNALVVGRSGRHGALVLTSGLLERADRIGLEGVLAHLLARLRSGATEVEAQLAVVASTVLAPLPGVAGALARRVVPESREIDADLGAVSLTRYPPGLLRALALMAEAGSAVAGSTRATGHLWLVPVEPSLRTASFSLEHRIAVLREL